MARRRIIEGTWRCTSCDATGIKGRHKVCPSCGNPREKGEMKFDFGKTTATGASTAATVTDAEALELADAGADWMCLNCDASNRGDRTVCRTCAAPKDDPFGEPVYEPVNAPSRSRKGPVGLVLGAISSVTAAMGTVCTCLGLGWYRADTEVQADITAMQWVRQVQVERLTPTRLAEWRDQLPEAGGLPGEDALSPGLGEIYSCDTLLCWPRPPVGGATVRVTGRQWERQIRTDVMNTRSRSGWRSAVPGSPGAMPNGGIGGRPGYQGLSCSRREKTPERCRNVSTQVACGTTERCTVNDLGNGFAEEVCVDVTEYCTEYEEECDPAVYDEWCTWTELSWGTGRSVNSTGTDDPPTWPLIQLRSNERETRRATYFLTVDVLAGRASQRLATSEDTFSSARDGELYYTSSLGEQRLPRALQTTDRNRHDCGDGIDMDVLTSRDRCDVDVWDWVLEDPLRAASDAGAPEWPDGRLGQDGRSTQDEWMLVQLDWTRGEKPGEAVFREPVEQWDAWKTVVQVPVVVDFDAGFVALGEDWAGPVPQQVRAGRIGAIGASPETP